MTVFTLLIINKAGGLIYNRDFNPGLNKLTINDYLLLAGTFHTVHNMTLSLTPAPVAVIPGTNPPQQAPRSSLTGIEVLESALFRLTCFQTVSGTKFLLFTEPQQPNVDVMMKKVYELYADYVMKNPFYSLEMPIRCEAFERHLIGFMRAK